MEKISQLENHELVYRYIFTLQRLSPYGGNKSIDKELEPLAREMIKRNLLTKGEARELRY